MKAPPKRKGNATGNHVPAGAAASMKAPPKRKGNRRQPLPGFRRLQASMKAPQKRKGNQG